MSTATELVTCPCIVPHNPYLLTADPDCPRCEGRGEIEAREHPAWCPTTNLVGAVCGLRHTCPEHR